MYYHYKHPQSFLPVKREILTMMRNAPTPAFGNSVGLPYRLDEHTSFDRWCSPGEQDRAAEILSRPLLSVNIPDGTWIAHRPQIVEFARSALAEFGMEPAVDLKIARNWTRHRESRRNLGTRSPQHIPRVHIYFPNSWQAREFDVHPMMARSVTYEE